MKKLLALILIVLVIAGCSPKAAKLEHTAKEAIKLFEDKEDFVLVLSVADCPACIAYRPTLEETLKSRKQAKVVLVDMYYNKEDLKDLVENHIKQDIAATPTTFFIKNGVVDDFYVGDRPYTDFINTLKLKGYINE